MARKTKKEMYPIVEAWQASEQNKSDFCRLRQLNIHTFTYWQAKYQKEKKPDCSASSSNKFVTLDWSSSSGGVFIELLYPNGVRLSLNGQVSVGYLSGLIKLAE